MLEGEPDGAAILTFWAIDDRTARPGAREIVEALLEWSAAWGAAPVVVRVLPDETESVSALLDLGLEELAAQRQPLPYRWFRGAPLEA